jgi:serine/threonine-protein kinase RsbW
MPAGSELRDAIAIPEDLFPGTVASFEKRIGAALVGHPEAVVLDCSQLNRVTSEHISMLWRARQNCELAGTSVRLESLHEGLVRVLRALDLEEFFVLGVREQAGNPTATTGAGEQSDQSFTHEFAASILGFNSAVARFNVFVQSLHIADTLVSELQTLFYEIGFNIIKHARLEPRDRITVTGEANRDRVQLRFVDPGIPFDTTQYATVQDFPSAASQRRTGGLGIMMVQRLSNHLSYSRTSDGRNVLVIEKRIVR